METIRMLYKAIGVPDAIPPPRRPAVAGRMLRQIAIEDHELDEFELSVDDSSEWDAPAQRVIMAVAAAFDAGQAARRIEVGIVSNPDE